MATSNLQQQQPPADGQADNGGGDEDTRKKRSENWTDEETVRLIGLWKEFMGDLRAFKRNRKIYAKMVDRLRDQGVHKTVDNVKTKLQNLTTAYRKQRRLLERGCSSSSAWKFWVILDAMLGHQYHAMTNNRRTTIAEAETNGTSPSPPCDRQGQVPMRFSRQRSEDDRDNDGIGVTADTLQVQLDEDSQPILEPWDHHGHCHHRHRRHRHHHQNHQSNTSGAATSEEDDNEGDGDGDSTCGFRHTADGFPGTSSRKARKRRRRAAASAGLRNVCEQLLAETRRGNDILESMEKSTLDIFREVVAGQKRALELQNRSLILQETLVNAFLGSQNQPPFNSSK